MDKAQTATVKDSGIKGLFNDFMRMLRDMNKLDWAFLVCLIFVAALLSSKYILSLCTIFLGALAALDVQLKSFKVRFSESWKELPKRIFSKPEIALVSLIFLTYLVFGFHSEDQARYWAEVRMKISFVAWPIIFLLLPNFTKRQYLLLFYFLIVNVFMSSIFVLLAYYSELYLFTQTIGYGHSIPTPINHIRYSMLVSISIMSGVVLIREKLFWRAQWERYLIVGLTIFLFVFQHVLSVRTGLLMTYMGLFFLVVFYFLKSTSKVALLLTLVAILFVPLVAYNTIPAFKKKVGYTLYDFNKWKSGEGSGYSDSERIRSWQAGVDIGSTSSFIGTGFGDVRDDVAIYYREKYETEEYWKPHSQYISVYAGGGVLGLLLFLFGFFAPIFLNKRQTNPMVYIVFGLFGISMLVEASLNSYIGSAMFLVFAMVGLKVNDT